MLSHNFPKVLFIVVLYFIESCSFLTGKVTNNSLERELKLASEVRISSINNDVRYYKGLFKGRWTNKVFKDWEVIKLVKSEYKGCQYNWGTKNYFKIKCTYTLFFKNSEEKEDNVDADFLFSKESLENKIKKATSSNFIFYDDKSVEKRNKEAELLERKARIESEIEKQKESLKNSAKYKKYYDIVRQKKIVIGMPEDLLILSWGNPSKISKSVGKWGVHKQYIYADNYVYVENGKITSWQSF